MYRPGLATICLLTALLSLGALVGTTDRPLLLPTAALAQGGPPGPEGPPMTVIDLFRLPGRLVARGNIT